MNKSFFKVLSILEGYLFRQRKFVVPRYDICGDQISIENNIDECKKRINTTYKNQSVTVFIFDENDMDYNNSSKKLIYDNTDIKLRSNIK